MPSMASGDGVVDHERMPSEPAITFIRPQHLTTKAPYAYAAVTGAGQFVFTAGACPLDADGNTVAVGDVAGQTHQVMANLAVALQAAGAQLTHVVKTTIFVASSQQADLGLAWDVVRAAFGNHDAPSTLLGVSVLGYDDQLVEVEAIAILPQQSS
jgi:enamine deaminase RidA (YjgF/YER057c/UK114 family)